MVGWLKRVAGGRGGEGGCGGRVRWVRWRGRGEGGGGGREGGETCWRGKRLGKQSYLGPMSVDRMIISDRKDGQFCSNLFKVVMLDLRT